MSKSLIILLTIFLNSCYHIKPKPFCDISFKPKERCRCRCFNYNNLSTLPDTECDTKSVKFKSGNYPIQKCQGIAGPYIKDYAEHIKPKYLENVDYCRSLEDPMH